jgi:hypothetical protein
MNGIIKLCQKGILFFSPLHVEGIGLYFFSIYSCRSTGCLQFLGTDKYRSRKRIGKID